VGNVLNLVIGYVLGLLPAIFFIVGWRTHKNITDYGILSPKFNNLIRGKNAPIVNTPERERELEQEMLEDSGRERPDDLLPESY